MREPKENKKIVLGLTGGFGTGKSTVAGILAGYGAGVIDADKINHSLIAPGTLVYKKILKAFGRDILKNNNGAIDRGKLGGIVFSDPKALKRLCGITHPAVIREVKRRVKSAKNDVVVVDAPLLIEAGLDKLVDKIIVVALSRGRQLKRLAQKTSLSRPEILKRIGAQLSLKSKVRLADFVIDNSGTIEKTRKQVALIWRLLWRS
ncbi:MAG: dephospho-CoA kinase [Candidatus Omnitrophica bacterium]|jgi:dephospho-CoA kinase|nr:dephospho-CoA kinase [Candidatus Omnitrophota bacterium]MDD5079827.1 dephospho-CoA kinase [Candidatus Omnitrophota bacterium]